jgi:ABC-type sugar transport system permease subunit
MVVQHYFTISMLLVIAIGVLIAYCKLNRTLKTQYHEQFLTHGRKLFYFVIGLETSINSYLIVLILPFIFKSNLAGLIQIFIQEIATVVPVLMYVWIVDATEDCFDCFNRCKDSSGGAQALSIFQIVEKKIDEQE